MTETTTDKLIEVLMKETDGNCREINCDCPSSLTYQAANRLQSLQTKLDRVESHIVCAIDSYYESSDTVTAITYVKDALAIINETEVKDATSM